MNCWKSRTKRVGEWEFTHELGMLQRDNSHAWESRWTILCYIRGSYSQGCNHVKTKRLSLAQRGRRGCKNSDLISPTGLIACVSTPTNTNAVGKFWLDLLSFCLFSTFKKTILLRWSVVFFSGFCFQLTHSYACIGSRFINCVSINTIRCAHNFQEKYLFNLC